MRIDIRSNGFALTETVREHAARRLRFALSGTVEQVRRVAVHLCEVEGAHGSRDKRCRVRVMLKDRAEVVIDDVETDLHAAIDRAANRAGRCVARSLAQQRRVPAAVAAEPNVPSAS